MNSNAGAVSGTSARPADAARVPPQHGDVPLPLPHVGCPPRHHRRRQVRTPEQDFNEIRHHLSAARARRVLKETKPE